MVLELSWMGHSLESKGPSPASFGSSSKSSAMSTVNISNATNSSGTSTSTPVKRACDSCHRRKVKCIGEGLKPCKNCVSAGLTCTYNAIPQKKGPKGSRAKVLSELRENQRQSQLAPSSFDRSFGARSLSPAKAKTPGLLTIGLIEACVDYYFQNIYQTQPILHRQKVQQAIITMDHCVEAYCKLSALCAFVLIQPHLVLPPNVVVRTESGAPSNFQLSCMLLEEAIRVRRNYDFIENPTLLTIYTSFFIFECYFCMDKQNAAWVYLRQAMTLAHILGMHEEDTYKSGDAIENSRKRRLFWVLFITERAYAFKRHRPLTLYATIRLPSVDEEPPDTISLSGFVHLINLYKPFDDTFFGLWNRTSEGAIPGWLTQLQKQLSDALPTYLEGTETQAVDLRMSQQWLKTMVWQLAISHGFVSSIASDSTLSFQYPIDISRELVERSNEFSQHAMEVHGIGLIEKLFDIACTLIDVMAYVPPQSLSQRSNFDSGPRDYLNRFIQLISTLRGGQSRYLPLIVNKVNEVLPSHSLPLSLSRNLQANAASGSNTRLEDVYESSGGSASQEATPYDSPPSHGPPASGLSMRPAQHLPSSQYSSYSGHYDNASSQVAGGASDYSMFQTPIGYAELSHAGVTQQAQASQGNVASVYSGQVQQMGGVTRAGGYGE